MSFFNRIKQHEHSEEDEILYHVCEALKNLLEVQTKPPDPERATEWREAVYEARIALLIMIAWLEKKDYESFEDEDEEEEES